MAPVDRVDRKLKHLRSLEASYRRDLKQASQAHAAGQLPQAKWRRVERRLTRKIEHLLERIRELAHPRG